MALWFLLTLFRSALRKLKSWPSNTNSAVTLATMLGVMGILVHSFVDFNLQIPGNAALFYVLCMLCAMEPRFGRHLRKERANASREGTILPPPQAFRLELAIKKH
jgi:hypothetical protein